MEPMTLGSPVHSPPQTPGSGVLGSPPNHSGFLPGFLMGDTTSPPQATSRILSPSKLNRSLSHQQQQQVSTPRFNKSIRGTPGGEKTPGGPPVTGLYSKVGGTPQNHLLNNTPNTQIHHMSSSFIPNNPISPGGTSDNDPSPWITVFGFPPSATGYILSQFSQYGVILQHESPPNGNWMHIRYQTKMMSQKALSKNGKVLGGSIMIGVAAGGQREDPESSVLNASENNPPHLATPLNSSVFNASKLETSHLNRSSIRPLTQAYKVSQNEHEVLADSNTPNKNSGFVNKAMEYIFGW